MVPVVGADRRDAPLKEIRRLRRIVQTERNEARFKLLRCSLSYSRVRLGDPHLLHLPRNLTKPIFRTNLL